MHRDRLVCGVLDTRIRHCLLTKTKMLKFQELLELAQAIESADRNSKDLQASKPSSSEAAVYQVQRQRNPQRTGAQPTASPTCNRCGARSHKANDCKFKDAVCYHCKKVGHLAQVCRSRKREGGQQKPRGTHQLEEVQNHDQSEDSPTYTLFRTSMGNKPKPILVTMIIDKKELQFEVDTGASASVISEQIYRKLWQENPPKLTETQVKLQTYTGEKIKNPGFHQGCSRVRDTERTAGPTSCCWTWTITDGERLACKNTPKLERYAEQNFYPNSKSTGGVRQTHVSVQRGARANFGHYSKNPH